MAKPKVSKDELDLRRELIRGFMARGITRPSKILQQPQMKDLYSLYDKPIQVITHDIKVVRRENAKVLGTIQGDEVLGDYRVGLQELITKTWKELEATIDDSNPFGVNLLVKRLQELYRDYARSMGVDVEKLDPQMILNLRGGYSVDSRIEGEVAINDNRIPDDPRSRAIATELVKSIRTGSDKSGQSSDGSNSE